MDESVDRTRLVVGAMTGTSMDGLDAALVRIHATGLSQRAELIRTKSAKLGDLADVLRACSQGQPLSAGQVATAAHHLGELHASVIAGLCNNDRPDLVCLHGQTVFHCPPVSWQLLNPQPVVHRIDCPLVFDVRQADLAAGGQGAPITPLADWVLFRDSDQSRAVVNLGGFCNVTILPRASANDDPLAQLHAIRACDVCACNHVLDGAARALLHAPYDDHGASAARGTPDQAVLDDLVHTLKMQHKSGRSLGTHDECAAALEPVISQCNANDGLATVTLAVARVVADVLNASDVDEVLLAGGGCHHTLLMQLLQDSTQAHCRTTDALGVPFAMREAVCMAVLGALCEDGMSITLPQVTRCTSPAPLAGMWCYPERGIRQ